MAEIASSVVSEFMIAPLGDARLQQRMERMVSCLERNPAASFPEAFGDLAGVEGGYRFLRNPRVAPEAILQPHRAQTWQRAAEERLVLSVEDTTEARFRGVVRRDGLGTLINDGQGFLLHGALLVGFGERPVPLGVAAYEILVRTKRGGRKQGVPWKRVYNSPDNERRRWDRVLDDVAKDAKTRGLSVVHVGDREADDYGLLSHCLATEERFVFRLRFDRKTSRTDETIRQVLGKAACVVTREVDIEPRTRAQTGSRRNKKPHGRRTATLTLRAAQITLSRPKHAKGSLPEITLNVVEAIELDPPPDTEAIHWALLTTEPISTPEEIERIVDIYRARWLIEELWKALKTGCAFEDRQLESRKTLETALALLLPLAWHMLLLRGTARSAPTAGAHRVLGPQLLELLRRIACVPNPWGLKALPPEPAVSDVVNAVARMGGHLPQNGEPGWLVLRRGLDRLYGGLAVAELLAAGGSDQC